MRSFQGGIEHSAYAGCISSAYIPLVPLRHVVTDYFKYLLKCPSYITALAGTSDLVRDGQAMRYENFCAIDLIIVPEAEQIEIANYLKAMDERTEKSLALQEAQIAKLKEYRSILINAAVTGKIKVPEV
jgi:type I restriction enzyme S subunit